MILGTTAATFGGLMRLGDIIACANVVEHLRQQLGEPELKFNIVNSVQPTPYVQEFLAWMTDNTDYFSQSPAERNLPWARVNLWDYRDIAGDLVVIKNKHLQQKKIVVNPIFDAAYNTYRNWPQHVYNEIIQDKQTAYPDYDLVIVNQYNITIDKWRCSTNLTDTLMEIMTAEQYIGGDTGLSHFAGALDRGPEPTYYTSSRGLLHGTPFNWISNKKGTMKTYWLDFERTQW